MTIIKQTEKTIPITIIKEIEKTTPTTLVNKKINRNFYRKIIKKN